MFESREWLALGGDDGRVGSGVVGVRGAGGWPGRRSPRGQSGCSRTPASRWFAGDGHYLLITNGIVGTNGFGNHKHNDQLSLRVSRSAGTPLIVDPGSFVYTSDPDARNRFRGTAYHNTLQIDGVEQNEIQARVAVSACSRALARTSRFRPSARMRSSIAAVMSATHRLESPVVHERRSGFDAGTADLEIDGSAHRQRQPCAGVALSFCAGGRCRRGATRGAAGCAPARERAAGAGPMVSTPKSMTRFYSPSYGVKVPCAALSLRLTTELSGRASGRFASRRSGLTVMANPARALAAPAGTCSNLIAAHRQLLAAITRVELAKRYAGSVLGMAWLVLQPALLLAVYLFVYMVVFKVRFPGFSKFDYVLFVFCGLVPLSRLHGGDRRRGALSIKENIHLVKNVMLPIELIPVRTVLVGDDQPVRQHWCWSLILCARWTARSRRWSWRCRSQCPAGAGAARPDVDRGEPDGGAAGRQLLRQPVRVPADVSCRRSRSSSDMVPPEFQCGGVPQSGATTCSRCFATACSTAAGRSRGSSRSLPRASIGLFVLGAAFFRASRASWSTPNKRCAALPACGVRRRARRIRRSWSPRCATRMAHRGPNGGGPWVDAGSAHRAWPPPAVDHRSRAARESADGQRRRLAAAHLQRRDLQPRRDPARAANRAAAIAGAPITRTPKSSCTPSRSGASTACTRFRGMFAFALWDARQRAAVAGPRSHRHQAALLLPPARPAWRSPRRSRRCSKIPSQRRAIDEEALFHYLSFLTTPGAADAVRRHSESCRAGTWLRVDADGRIEERRYWDVWDHAHAAGAGERRRRSPSASSPSCAPRCSSARSATCPSACFSPAASIRAPTRRCSPRASAARSRRSRSATTAIVSRAIRTSCRYARQMAARVGADHHEYLISRDDVIDFLPQMVHLQDEPIADPVCVPVYYVAKLAREHGIIVCQVGEGADELFIGYPDWLEALERQQHGRLAGAARREAGRRCRRCARAGYDARVPVRVRCAAARAASRCSGAAPRPSRTRRSGACSSPRLRRALGGLTSWDAIRADSRALRGASARERSHLNWMSYVDLSLRLPELLLMRVDKMTHGRRPRSARAVPRSRVRRRWR